MTKLIIISITIITLAAIATYLVMRFIDRRRAARKPGGGKRRSKSSNLIP